MTKKIREQFYYEAEQLERLSELTKRLAKATQADASVPAVARTVFRLGLDAFGTHVERLERLK